jgi:hypothetical protein
MPPVSEKGTVRKGDGFIFRANRAAILGAKRAENKSVPFSGEARGK